MSLFNRPFYRNLLVAAVLSLSVGACTTTPTTAPEAPMLQQADPDCSADCQEEDGSNRYQYYLGVLSVFLLG